MQAPTTNRITQTKHGAFNAVDYDNEPDPFFYAPEDGIVTGVGDSDATCGFKLYLTGGTGKSGFCHIEHGSYAVSNGQRVGRGQKLAKMGYSGLTVPDNVPKGTHLHWTLNRNGSWVYPPLFVNEPFKKEGEKKMLSEDDFYRVFRGMMGRDPTSQEAKSFSRDPAVVIPTLWNNGSKARFEADKAGDAGYEEVPGPLYKKKG